MEEIVDVSPLDINNITDSSSAKAELYQVHVGYVNRTVYFTT